MKRRVLIGALSVALSVATFMGSFAGVAQPLTVQAAQTAYAETSTYAAYDSNAVYIAGDRVVYNGAVYEAKWWTKGETPNPNLEWGVWKLISTTTETPVEPSEPEEPSQSEPETPVETEEASEPESPVESEEASEPEESMPGDTYDPLKVYYGGERVIYHGATYEARWWTQGDIPDPNAQWGVWKLVEGTPIDPEEPSQSEPESPVETEESSEPETTVEPTESEETEEPSEPETTVDPEEPKPPVDVDTSRLLIGYWHTWGGGASGGVPFVKLRDVDDNWDVINVSFAEPVVPGSTDGRMKFVVSGLTSDYTDADFKKDIKLLQSKGKKVVLSIGGYEGYFSLTSDSAVKQFVSDIKGFIDEYGFDGIDIDLEQSSVTLNSGTDPDFRNPQSVKVVNMIDAIEQICASYGDDFILSWAPETFYMQLGHQFYAGLNGYVDARSGVYLPMIEALRDRTSYVHVQLYNSIAVKAPDGNSYSMGSTESTVAMCKMLLDGFDVNGNSNYFFEPLRPDQVVIGVPSSAGAAGSGHISNENLQSAFRTLEQEYPGMRGIMTWSINWDVFQNNNSFAKSNGAFLDSFK